MMRRCVWVLMVCASGLCVLPCGCGEQKPKSGGVSTVSPPITPKTTAPDDKGAKDESKEEKKTDAGDTTDDKKVKPPADAGSTTGGGTETPETPGDGQ